MLNSEGIHWFSHLCSYLVPLILLLLHSEDGVDVVFQQLVRQLAHTGMVLKRDDTEAEYKTVLDVLVSISPNTPPPPPAALTSLVLPV